MSLRVESIVDPVASAKAAGLQYVTDEMPGIRRIARGKHFAYIAPNGKEITDDKELARIKSIGVPPAYTDVWICPLPNGHLQATARDARGRKQYRYHKRFREIRDESKYTKMILFAETLPKIRKRVEADIGLPGLHRNRVLAAVVQLLQTTAIRVGNDEYAKENKHYGLTTLRNIHAKIDGANVHFSFMGKSGVRHVIELHDRRLAKIIRQCQELPGQRLFEYVDDDGALRAVESADVNAYIREVSEGEEFSAKDFRTWLGTVTCAMLLSEQEAAKTLTERKAHVTEVVKQVAKRLGNTAAVCRKAYIHPHVLEAYMEGGQLNAKAKVPHIEGLMPEELFVLALLHERAKETDSEHTMRLLQRSLHARKKKAA